MSTCNINTATLGELLALPYIGKARAQAIIELRHQEQFRCVEDLGRLRGLGKKRLVELAKHVRFEDPVPRNETSLLHNAASTRIVVGGEVVVSTDRKSAVLDQTAVESKVQDSGASVLCHRCEGKAPFECDHAPMPSARKAGELVLAFTGHRPQDLPGGWKEFEIHDSQTWIKRKIFEVIRKGYALGYRWVISGGALGVDMWAAEIALRLREKEGLSELKLLLAIPHLEHWGAWKSERLLERYWTLRQKADLVRVVSEGGYSPEAMHARNAFMVRHANLVIAFWNGKKGGGTYGCIRHALKKEGLRVYHYNPIHFSGKALKA